nr:MAG TPA: virion morphogenesis protein [Caudoviricetes sp.]
MTVDDKSKVPEILANLRELESYQVAVGILSKSGGEMLMIANVHEFGCSIPVTDKMRGFLAYNYNVHLKRDTKVIKIPERSFVRTSYDNKSDMIYKKGEDLVAEVVKGNMSARAFYELLGQTCADTIRDYMINEVNSPANSELTIANKGSSNPLVDSGHLAAAVTYEIRSR